MPTTQRSTTQYRGDLFAPLSASYAGGDSGNWNVGYGRISDRYSPEEWEVLPESVRQSILSQAQDTSNNPELNYRTATNEWGQPEQVQGAARAYGSEGEALSAGVGNYDTQLRGVDVNRLNQIKSEGRAITPQEFQQVFGTDAAVLNRLRPEVREKVLADPLTFMHGQLGWTEKPDNLPQGWDIAGRNAANQSFLSVGAEGGYRDLGKLQWVPNVGLVSPTNNYMAINDDDLFGDLTSLVGLAAMVIPGLQPMGMALGGMNAMAKGDVLGGALNFAGMAGFNPLQGASQALGGGPLAGAAVRGATGGLSVMSRGGNFGQGFTSGALSSLGNSAMQQMGSTMGLSPQQMVVAAPLSRMLTSYAMPPDRPQMPGIQQSPNQQNPNQQLPNQQNPFQLPTRLPNAFGGQQGQPQRVSMFQGPAGSPWANRYANTRS